MKRIITSIVPERFLTFYYGEKSTPEKIFTKVYTRNKWGIASNGGKYYSGPGSADTKVGNYKRFLINFIKSKGITTIFEIGAGDFRIMKSVLGEVSVNYVGGDIVKELIDYLVLTYSDEKTDFLHLNAINLSKLPKAELCIIRQVLQHLDNAQISEILKKTEQYRYVLITEDVPLNPEIKNENKKASGSTGIQNKIPSGVYLDAEPFSLNANVVFSYRYDEHDTAGRLIPALIQTSLIENIKEPTASKV